MNLYLKYFISQTQRKDRHLSQHRRKIMGNINHLKMNGKPLYLKAQFVPRSKHFSSWL